MSDYFERHVRPEVESHRAAAQRLDKLADAAEADGDTWDAAECRRKAMEHKRAARRLEALKTSKTFNLQAPSQQEGNQG